MKTTINDTLNDRVYKLKHIYIEPGFDRGLYGQYYFTVNAVLMDESNMMGESIEVARFFHKSQHPDKPRDFEGTPIPRVEALDNARLFARGLAKEYGVDLEISSAIKFD